MPRVRGTYAALSAAMPPDCASCGGACCKICAIQRKSELPLDVVQCLRVRGHLIEDAEFIGIVSPCKHFAGGKCLIHLDKPDYCRTFAVNSEACRAVRALVNGGEPPLQ